MEVPRLGVESELQLPAYTTATLDPTHSLWQCQILNPLSEARDRTSILTDTGPGSNPLSHKGNSSLTFFLICTLFGNFDCSLCICSRILKLPPVPYNVR